MQWCTCLGRYESLPQIEPGHGCHASTCLWLHIGFEAKVKTVS